MTKTKQKILDSALQLFNEHGVADVSIRQIAKAANISHSNLIYHFPSKGEVILALHNQLLARAIQINQEGGGKEFDVRNLFIATKAGFETTYHYRFFFFDLLYICNTVAEVRNLLIEVEGIRSAMYLEVINLSVKKGLMRQEAYPGEYDQFVKRIKIFSDHWISSSAIYEDLQLHELVHEYSMLLLSGFYPYLTSTGRTEFEQQQLTSL